MAWNLNDASVQGEIRGVRLAFGAFYVFPLGASIELLVKHDYDAEFLRFGGPIVDDWTWEQRLAEMTEGEFNKWISGVVTEVNARLANLFQTSPPAPPVSQPRNLEEFREWLRHLRFSDNQDGSVTLISGVDVSR